MIIPCKICGFSFGLWPDEPKWPNTAVNLRISFEIKKSVLDVLILN